MTQPDERVIEFVPGSSSVRAGLDRLILVPEGGRLVDQLVEAESVAEWMRTLDLATAADLPAFGFATWSEGTLHVAIRGEVQVQVFPQDSPPFQLDGTGLVTWFEQRFTEVAAVALAARMPETLPEVDVSTEDSLHACWARALVEDHHVDATPAIDRPVETTALVGHPAPDPAPLHPAPTPPTPAIEPPPVTGSPGHLDPPDDPRPPQATPPIAKAPPDDTATPASSEAGPSPALPDRTPVWPPPPPSAGSDLGREMQELLGTTTSAEALAQIAATATPPTAGHDAPPENATPPSSPGSAPDPPVGPAGRTAAHLPAPADEPTITISTISTNDPAPTPPAKEARALIAGVPGMAAPTPAPATPSPPPPPSPPIPPAADPPHPAPGPAPPPQPAPAPAGPAVQAVRCPHGHPNPPHADTCRSCRAPITDRAVAQVARPTLGTLVLTDGQRIALTGPLVMGRNPSTSGPTPQGENPTLVQLPDTEQVLSRTHLEVRIIDWQVQVIDRDSRNGTFVTLPGRPAFRLHPSDPYPIPPGTVVTLGTGASFTYDTENPHG